MKLYVPTNGDQLRLTVEWKFVLYNKRYDTRNKTMFVRCGVKTVQKRYNSVDRDTYSDWPEKALVSLPAFTVLQVDRVYIRKFNRSAASVDDDFDSITFQVIDHPTWQREGKNKVMARFWVKLRDANTIEFDHASPPRWSEEKEDET